MSRIGAAAALLLPAQLPAARPPLRQAGGRASDSSFSSFAAWSPVLNTSTNIMISRYIKIPRMKCAFNKRGE
ncbi:MAG TPA: hypothetical protein VMV49_10320 [Candidatus Deferrimicrobium sp.]|nr:hypothetical protein [Candidatus Deferrimicrobium sp.]